MADEAIYNSKIVISADASPAAQEADRLAREIDETTAAEFAGDGRARSPSAPPSQTSQESQEPLANEVQRVPSGHGNGGQFTGKTNQPVEVTHTPEEEKRIADYQASTDQSVVDFYEQIKGIDDAETLSKAKCKIGIVSHEYATRVKELTGLDTEGWTIELRGNRAKHIDIRHGGSGKQDQSLADSNDVG